MPPRSPRTSLRQLSDIALRIRGGQRRGLSGPYGYEQAKALVYSSHGEPSDVLRLHGHSISPPHSHKITIRFLASPINPADINQIQGSYPAKPAFESEIGTARPSAVGGNEGVAEVVGAGSAVKSVGKGDWVVMKKTGFGTWRTHAQCGEDAVLRVEKEGLKAVQAGTVSVNPCTAYRMLKDFGTMREGDWFVQNGANSGVGRAAIQLGRLWGFKSINVVRDRAELQSLKRELKELGADVVVTEDEIRARDFRDKLNEWTRAGRERVALGLNCVGGESASSVARQLSAGAAMVTYGGMSKRPVQLPTALLIFKDLVFHGFWVSRWSDANPEEKKRTLDHLLDLTRRGRFADVPVDETRWDFDTAQEELVTKVQQGLEGFRKGKGVFVFGDT